MDNAVSLVQAYLRVNGYFTVTEYPVVEAARSGGFQSATDLDILAFRFGRPEVLGKAGGRPNAGASGARFRVDPALDLRPDLPDMIIGEVKEGRALLNRGAKDERVLAAAVARFGCCDEESAEEIVTKLMRKGRARTPHGHRVRLVAFGSFPPERKGHHDTILLGPILDYLRDHVARHWPVMEVSETKDPVMGLLKLQEKARRAAKEAGDDGA